MIKSNVSYKVVYTVPCYWILMTKYTKLLIFATEKDQIGLLLCRDGLEGGGGLNGLIWGYGAQDCKCVYRSRDSIVLGGCKLKQVLIKETSTMYPYTINHARKIYFQKYINMCNAIKIMNREDNCWSK